MDTIFVSILLGFGMAAALYTIWKVYRSRPAGSGPSVTVHSSIEELRSVGELIVFKIVTKEIVTAADHWLGETGKKYFAWLISTKKMAMIFEFDIDFRFDLRSPDFKIIQEGEAGYRFKMPRCYYETHIRDISFYDEQASKLMPWLVPDLLNRALGSGFDEESKNRLKEEAKQQASKMAEDLVGKMRGEVQTSARQTLEALARAFGADKVTIEFTESAPIQRGIEIPANGETSGLESAAPTASA